MGDDATVGGPPSLPGFEFEGALGAGGFAEVFRYRQADLDRSVAVKVLHGFDDEARRFFRAEAHIMARLSSHPSVVPIYQIGEAADGRPYLVMQYCPRPHLADRIRSGPLPVADVLDAGVALAGAVESAHRLGVLHRDIKPANILFDEYGRPMLADFGIARSAEHGDTLHAYSPDWAPPEQIAGAPATPQADVYALAATLWAMLTGAPPPGPVDAAATRPATGRDDVPELLGDVLAAGLARDPAARPRSALSLARHLQQVQQQLGRPVRAVELWDGHDTTRSPAPPPPADEDRTHLIALDTRPDPAAPGEPRTQSPAARPAAPPAPAVASPATPPAPAEAPRRGPGPALAALAVAAVPVVALVAGLWWQQSRLLSPSPEPTSPASTTRPAATSTSVRPSEPGPLPTSTPASTSPTPQRSSEPGPAESGPVITGGWG